MPVRLSLRERPPKAGEGGERSELPLTLNVNSNRLRSLPLPDPLPQYELARMGVTGRGRNQLTFVWVNP